jgi:hypothetical protein
MKKIMLFLAVIGVAFCTSCKKELTSLEGTTWVVYYRDWIGSDHWSMYKLSFTSTHATYVETHSSNNKLRIEGRYTFDPPNVEIVSNSFTLFGEPPIGTFSTPEEHHLGTVDGKTMRMTIFILDEGIILDLTKQ